MTDLITEARELCQKHNPCENCEYAYDDICRDRFCVSREKDRLITELCDALEKAEEKNKQLMHELCKLACESVEWEKALARLEAKVVSACNSVRWIPVTEQLPTERGYYLAVIKRIAPDELGGNLTNVKIMRWLGEDWRYPVHVPEWINEAITETVTHWMELPAPPEEGEGK